MLTTRRSQRVKFCVGDRVAAPSAEFQDYESNKIHYGTVIAVEKNHLRILWEDGVELTHLKSSSRITKHSDEVSQPAINPDSQASQQEQPAINPDSQASQEEQPAITFESEPSVVKQFDDSVESTEFLLTKSSDLLTPGHIETPISLRNPRKHRSHNVKRSTTAADIITVKSEHFEQSNSSDSDLKVLDALDLIETDSNHCSADIFICPPNDPNCSDEDSGDENGGEFNNLSGNQLSATCELHVFKTDGSDLIINDKDDIQTLAATGTGSKASQIARLRKQLKNKSSWMKAEGPFMMKPNRFHATINSYEPPQRAEVDKIEQLSPVHFFELFMDEEVLQKICDYSNAYAIEKKGDKFTSPIEAHELKTFLAILMLSGYNKLPGNRMYWQEKEDVHNNLVSHAMRRNRFVDILSVLHLCDNSEIPAGCNDKCAKIRPIVDMIQERCLKYAQPCRDYDVDESMVKYYGKFGAGMKQRMPQKPIRMGYKIWSLNSSNGYLNVFKIYQGKGSQNKYTAAYGLGPSIVIELCEKLPRGNFHCRADNYFMSIPLLRKMKSLEIGCTGTFKSNMIEDCPLTNRKVLKKEARGSIDSAICRETDIVLTQWVDNNVVIVGSNCTQPYPTDKAKRYNASKKSFFEVERPNMITQYNDAMGGTDCMDQALNEYSPSIRNRKWYYPLFLFLLKVSSFNAWILHKEIQTDPAKRLPYLEFIRYIVRDYLKKYQVQARSSKKVNTFHYSKVSNRVSDEVRFDRDSHFPDLAPKKSRCALCGKTTQHFCIKCDVKLHIQCFATFHGVRSG